MIGLIKTMRIHQWTKNFLIFAVLIFSKNLSNTELVLQAVVAFFSFCLLSSAVYVVNDVLDAEKDRLHPKKRNRPIAAGKLSRAAALGSAVLLGILSFAIASRVDQGLQLSLILGGYLFVNVCYCFVLKRVVIADVLTVAVGFLLRIKAGGVAVGVPLSPWLILCTFFLASFLAICKRRSELALTENSADARTVLADYSFPILDVLVAVTASVSIMTYALYTVAVETVDQFGTKGIIYTLPVVLFGIGRYIFLVYQRKEGEDPAAVIFTDGGIILAVILWVAIAIFAVYGGMGEVIGK